MDLAALKRANEIQKELDRIKPVLNDLEEKSNYEFDVNYPNGIRKKSLTNLLSSQFKKCITDQIVTALITRFYLLEKELKSL